MVELSKPTTAEAINKAFQQAADGELDGILYVNEEPLVSSDFIGADLSSIVDAPMTVMMGGTMAKVMAWYDNEWGYSCRVADLTTLVAELL